MAIPLSFIAAVIVHIVLAATVKRVLVGTVKPGTHKRASLYGLRYWAAQRVVESTYATYGNILVGTWALNAMYRAFGARIGSMTIVRNKTSGITVPDMLTIGNRCTCQAYMLSSSQLLPSANEGTAQSSSVRLLQVFEAVEQCVKCRVPCNKLACHGGAAAPTQHNCQSGAC